MNLFPARMRASCAARVFTLVVFLMPAGRMHAQPVIVSTDPASGASGVPTSASLVIAFSEAMNTSATTPYLFAFDGTNYQSVPVSPSWTAGNTVLTSYPHGGAPGEPVDPLDYKQWPRHSGPPAGRIYWRDLQDHFSERRANPDEPDLERRRFQLRRALTAQHKPDCGIQQHPGLESVADVTHHQQPARQCSRH